MGRKSRVNGVVALVAGLVLVLTARGQSSVDKERIPGSECPTGYLCGQNADSTSGNEWYYSDLDPALCSDAAAATCPSHCIRRTAEDFPPPGVAPLMTPVGVINLVGAFNGPDKPQIFEIKFYPFDPSDPNRPLYNSPACSYPNLAPFQVTKIGQINWSGGGTGNEYQYTFVLPSPCTLAQGYFSVAIASVQAGSNWLWQPSDSTQGDRKTTRWWTSPNFCVDPLSKSDQDRAYCFGENRPGACCNDATAICDPNSNEFACAAVNGRFRLWSGNCSAMDPPCGSALGACCHEDGTCTQVTYAACVGSGACCIGTTCAVYSEAACIARHGIYRGNGTSCSPYPCGCCICRADANCDSVINFADINPFVQALSNLSAWQTVYPWCPWQNCDLNADGVVSFADINPFVTKLATPGPCPYLLRGSEKTQGSRWLGPDSLCTSCCTIIVDPTKPHENEPDDCATDNFNGGCNSSPTTFQPVPLNMWFYGQSGTFGAGYRDTDWYLITLAHSSNHTLTIDFQAEFDVQVQLARPGDCDANWPTGYAILNTATATKCADPNTTFITSRCLSPGNYWVIVSPQAFNGVPCGADYKIRVTDTAGCQFCNVTCPTIGNVYHSLWPCGPDDNNGCSPDPNLPGQFEFVGVDWTGTICGSLYAKHPQRDVDWYSFRITAPARIKWDVISEMPVRCSIEYRQLALSSGYLERIPPICDGSNHYWTATLFSACTLGSSSNELYCPDPNDPNVPFFMFIAPEDAAGPIYDGYPCGTYGTNENDYTIALTTTVLTCPTICVDFGWRPGVEPSENEPVCSTNYADTTNGGCDRLNVNQMTTLTDGVAICSQGGIYLSSGVPKPDYD